VKKITCIIVEDEKPAQRILESYITRIPELLLAGIFNNAPEAMPFLRSNLVDLLLLDINMPEMSGLEFLEILEPKPAVIITTAYGQYALEGFDHGVTDYLLKPFSFHRFCKAINRCAVYLGKFSDKSQDAMHGTISGGDIITIKVDTGVEKVPATDMLFIESCGNYLKINCVNKRYLIRETLTGFLQKLPAEQFLRVHRSFIVSIPKAGKLTGNMLKVGDHEIPVGNLFKPALRDILEGRG
jgi:DNA-binding LytR/AlgR family response regulator